MIRPDMEAIPETAFPSGYSLRYYRDGDRDTWVRIYRDADPGLGITGELFDKEFGFDLPAMRRRAFFLVSPDGRDVGTATAWYNRHFHGRRWGRVHWVAVIPDYQGRGLARPLTAAVLRRLRGLGHRRAMLVTQTHRLRAIKVYLDLGFLPDMTTPNAATAWQQVREALEG